MTNLQRKALASKTNRTFLGGFALLVLGVLCFWLAIQDFSLRNPEQILNREAAEIEKKLHKYERDFHRFVRDTSLINDLAKGEFDEHVVDSLAAKPYALFLYNSVNQLIFWNGNKTNLHHPASYDKNAGNLVRLKSGYFELLKRKVQLPDNRTGRIFALIPVYRDYEVENEYLQNEFALDLDVPSFISLKEEIEKDEVTVTNKDDVPLFSLQIDESQYQKQLNRSRLALELLMLLLFFGGLHFLAIRISNRVTGWGQMLVFGMLAATVCGLRYIMLQYQIPAEWAKLELFDPSVYASSSLNPTLGDLFINSMLFLWLAGFFVRHTTLPLVNSSANRFLTYASIAFVLFILLVMPSGLHEVVRSLVIDSNISFNLNNIFSLSIYSVVGLVVIILAFFSYFLIALKLLRCVVDAAISRKGRFAGLVAAMIPAFLGSLYFVTWPASLLIVLWTSVFLMALYYFLSRNREIISFTGVILFTVFFAAFAAAVLFRYKPQKEMAERKLFAKNLANERDFVTEHLFRDIEKRIMQDPFVKRYYTSRHISTSAILDRLKSLYLSGYFSKYNISIFPLDKEGRYLRGGRPVPFDYYLGEDMYQNAQLTSAEYLFFLPKPSGQYIYLANLPVLINNKFKGTLLVLMEPKSYIRSKLYPELLLSKQVKTSTRDKNYRFSVYVDDILVNSRNGHPRYDLPRKELDTLEENFYTCFQNGYSHLIYKPAPHKEVIVSRADRQFFNALSLFSYLIFFFIVFVFIQFTWSFLVRWIRGQTSPDRWFQLTLQKKIQYSMLLVIVLPFFIMGWVTIMQLRDEYNEYQRERLVRKGNAVLTDVERTVKKALDELPANPGSWNDFVSTVIEKRLNDMANIHSMDINLYGLDGQLLLSSQPDIFQKGLQSNQMEPRAFNKLARFGAGRVLQQESIGNLNYLSIYVPVKNPKGETLAYMNLPYFAKEKNLKQEINSFLVALINVYVFLLLCGGGLAFFLSESITRPLAEIRAKLRGVELGKQNKPINWQSADEVGMLISEYNKMIEELEHKADLLAKTERESAWREMAQQVAHEIKNPLTPMKLSIQHLQRALQEGRPDAEEQVQKVGNRLIEQIEHLSQIASEFSNFAKMPQASMEDVDLNKIVSSAVQLYEESDKADVTYHGPDEACIIEGDENQLSRAFTNLITNAVEAIPDDREGYVNVRLEEVDGQYQVTIVDNGEGIPATQQEKVFVPNFTTKGSGTGLGLAITKQIVENMGGSISFTSTEGEGTTFTIRIPKR